MYNVLILGSGGREHAIAWSIYNDSKISKLYCAPGNAGTYLICKNINLDIMNNNDILSFVQNNDINLIIVGPEQPLENGIVDFYLFGFYIILLNLYFVSLFLFCFRITQDQSQYNSYYCHY